MGLYRDLQFNKGTINDKLGSVGTSTGATLAQNEKGQAIEFGQGKYITHSSQLLPTSGAYSVVVWAKSVGKGTPAIASVTNGGASSIHTDNLSGALLFLGSNNYRYFTFNNDYKWHCFVFTVPGTAQADIASSQCFIDGISASVVSTDQTGLPGARTGCVYTGGGSTSTSKAFISRLKVYDTVLSQAEINAEYQEFLNAQPVNISKRGFVLPKPSDLSPLVRSSLTSLFTDTFSSDSSANYTGGANITSVTWNTSGYLTFIGSGGFMTVVRAGVISTTLPVTVIVRAKSSTLTTTLGLWNGSTYVQSTETLSTEYKTFVFRNHTSSTATMTLRPNISLTAGQDLVIDEIYSYTETGLVAAYNMKPNGNTLVDISGNGYNGTKSGEMVFLTKGCVGNPAGNFTTPTMDLNSDFSISFRMKSRVLGVNSDIMNLLVESSSTSHVWVRFNNGNQLILDQNLGGSAVCTTPYSVIGQELTYTINFVSSTHTTTFYMNGVLVNSTTIYNPVGIRSGVVYIGGYQLNTTYNLKNELIDLRIYNRVLSAQEIKDYHNQFVQPTLIEDFSDAGADGVTKSDAPREWERVSGTWKIGENVIAKSPVYTSDFSAGVDGWVSALGGSVAAPVTIGGLSNALEYTISGGSNYHVVQKQTNTVLGKRYTLTGKIYFPSTGSANGFQIASIDGFTVYNTITPVTQNTWYEFTTNYTAIGSNYDYIRIIPLVNGSAHFSNDGQKYYIKDINIIQIPQLNTMTNGTKYLENVSAGIIAIPSNTAYGSWEFDWFKGGASNSIVTGFISTTRIPTTTGTQGYVTEIGSDEALYLYAFTGSGFTSLMSTAVSYIANSTWYRIRITRSTAGVFTVLIKGGAFTPTAGYDGWTLVSVSGGAGTNPVTNTTYTSSGYFTLDLDAGDRVANIVIRDGIKQ